MRAICIKDFARQGNIYKHTQNVIKKIRQNSVCVFITIFLDVLQNFALEVYEALDRFCFLFSFCWYSAYSKGFQYHPYLYVFVRQKSFNLRAWHSPSDKQNKRMKNHLWKVYSLLLSLLLLSRFCAEYSEKNSKKNINFLINMPQIRHFFWSSATFARTLSEANNNNNNCVVLVLHVCKRVHNKIIKIMGNVLYFNIGKSHLHSAEFYEIRFDDFLSRVLYK